MPLSGILNLTIPGAELSDNVEMALKVSDDLIKKHGKIITSEGRVWYYAGTHWKALSESELRRVVHNYDGDTYGDNSDAFPNDSTEWLDTDVDGYGDNSDFYPSDASKWQQETTPVVTPPAAKSSSSGGSFGFSIMLMMLIGITRFRQK